MKHNDKKTRIIEAALKIFAKNGFYNSKISEIAKEADVADGTIYLYFKSKDDLLISLFEYEGEFIVANMKKEMSKVDDPIEKIRTFASSHLNMITRNRDLAIIIQVELRQSSKFMKEYVNKKFVEYLNLISYVIHEGQRKGIIREEIKPGIFKRAFFGALDEMARYWVLSPSKKYNPASSAKEISDIFVRGLIKEGYLKKYF
ncbi:MAG: TetR/AcrR family transcriptional regulator [Thermodesulfobacteriota bacterium]|nr:TetR/AcrR family transcriptional regulator [Thermodesulfobacteriota bacterium]